MKKIAISIVVVGVLALLGLMVYSAVGIINIVGLIAIPPIAFAFLFIGAIIYLNLEDE